MIKSPFIGGRPQMAKMDLGSLPLQDKYEKLKSNFEGPYKTKEIDLISTKEAMVETKYWKKTCPIIDRGVEIIFKIDDLYYVFPLTAVRLTRSPAKYNFWVENTESPEQQPETLLEKAENRIRILEKKVETMEKNMKKLGY